MGPGERRTWEVGAGKQATIARSRSRLEPFEFGATGSEENGAREPHWQSRSTLGIPNRRAFNFAKQQALSRA
jgi:hypothetical protein